MLPAAVAFASAATLASAMRCTLLVATAALSSGFYLPGVSPKEYKDGDRVEVKVNKLSSSVTQLPYNYYSMPFCKPNVDIVNAVENLGEVPLPGTGVGTLGDGKYDALDDLRLWMLSPNAEADGQDFIEFG